MFDNRKYLSEIETEAAIRLYAAETNGKRVISKEQEEKDDSIEPPTMTTVSIYLQFNDFKSDIKGMFDFIGRRLENLFLNKISIQTEILAYLKSKDRLPYLNSGAD